MLKFSQFIQTSKNYLFFLILNCLDFSYLSFYCLLDLLFAGVLFVKLDTAMLMFFITGLDDITSLNISFVRIDVSS